MDIRKRIESYKYQMSHSPKAKIIRTTAEKFQESKGLQNWANRENMKVVSKALNEMNASNMTLSTLCFFTVLFPITTFLSYQVLDKIAFL